MVKTSKIITALSVPVLAISLSACSLFAKGTADQRAVADQVNTLTEGIAEGDGAKICSIYDPADLQKKNLTKEQCATQVLKEISDKDKEDAKKFEVDPEKIVINGNSADVPKEATNDTEGTNLKFKKVNDTWYFDDNS